MDENAPFRRIQSLHSDPLITAPLRRSGGVVDPADEDRYHSSHNRDGFAVQGKIFILTGDASGAAPSLQTRTRTTRKTRRRASG